jgi:putative tricarboxylic transport membrane protein
MTNPTEGGSSLGPSHRMAELAVATAMAVFALIVITGAIRAGIGWGVEGPRAGFIPFYVGLILLAASIVNFIVAFREPDTKLFADWIQLRQVLSVVVPTMAYVALVAWIGIYLSSFLLIAYFMRWLGRYGWPLTLTISIAMPIIVFIVFERWFLVPLPKGHIEELLGF